MQNSALQPDFQDSFATPFAKFLHPHAAQLNPQLKSLFFEREAEGEKWQEQYAVPTLKVGIFESNFELFSWPDKCIQALRAFCMEALGQTIMSLNNYSPDEMRKLRTTNHCWFHITRKGGYMPAHNHPMASWSGVYCVDPGQPDANNPDSGVIRFHDPRPGTNMYMDAGNCRLKEPYASGMLTFRFVPGMLLLFPSSLYHDIAPFTSEGERITVAFNAWTRHVDTL